MRSATRSLCVALALTLSASPAAAQFTAVVQPPKSRPAADAAAATVPGATTNAQGNTSLTDMRAWVDSAAGVTAPAAADSLRDSTRLTTDAAGVVVDSAVATPAANAVDEAGMRAPDTATMLPAAALIGLAMLGAGAWLLRRARA